MSDMFEYLEAQAREDDGPFVNATSVSVDRAERRFGSFLSASKGDKEFNSRMDLVSNDIHKIAADVCEEYGYSDSEHVASIVIGQLQMLADRNSDSSKTDSVGEIKREKLDSQDPSGYYTEPSPKLNPGSAGDNMHNTNPSISELTPDERQHPDDLSYPNDGALPKANLVDADKPMQPENHVGDSTMTFGEGNQADPVTASKKKSEAVDFNDSVELEGYHSVLDQVKQMLYRGASVPQIMQNFGDKLRSWNIDESNLRDVMREQTHQKNLDTAQNWNLMRDMTSSVLNDFGGNSIAISAMEGEEDIDPDDIDALIDESIKSASRSENLKEAAERMDFNSFAEMMTPSEAIEELVGSGMPQHEAKDRIDFYVNHINPGWANKHWTSAAEDMEQAAMRNEMPATEGAGKWRAPQTPQEEAMINFAQQKFEKSIDEEVQSQVNAMLQGPDQNRTLEDEETGATYTLGDLAESGQLQEILKGSIMSINPDAGVKGIAVETGGVYSVPITRRTDVNYVQQQITEKEQRTIPGAGGGVAIGDRALQQKSEGLEPSRGPGPMGGPTGL
jgi:hypothetical protein